MKNVQAGIRQDVAGPDTTYAVLGIQGLSPYMFELDGALFLSHRQLTRSRVVGFALPAFSFFIMNYRSGRSVFQRHVKCSRRYFPRKYNNGSRRGSKLAFST